MAEKLFFDKSARLDVLNLIEKTVDQEGFIVEKENLSQRVLTFDLQEIKVEDFGGVKKGSEVFIKDNLVSLLKYIKR